MYPKLDYAAERRRSMVITRTPFRISFFGGGTDYPEWYCAHGGAVLSTAIDKYCYISCRYLPPFFATKHRVVWSHIELTQSISEILHPAVRAGLRMMEFDDTEGLEIHHQADLPARTGIGSSSAFAVGLIAALEGLRGRTTDNTDLYRKAIELERNWLHDDVGSQDQVAVAVGGFNLIRFHENADITIEPMKVTRARRTALNNNLMLFYTGNDRVGGSLASEVVARLWEHNAVLTRMRELVDDAARVLHNGDDLDDFGRLLHEAWELKKQLSSRTSNSTIDTIYDTARANGALGGKLLGAGSCGFMMFYVPLERQSMLSKVLRHLLCVPFRFADEGCTILHSVEAATALELELRVPSIG